MIRYRRNITCLSTNQLHDLREALAILFTLPPSSPHSWAHVAGLHGLPAPAWCIHGAPGFLTWHRAYLLALEDALHCLNPALMVPYWNWSSGPTTGVPAPCASATYVNRSGDTVANPLYAGPLPPDAGAAMTARRADIDTTSFADLATAAQAALTNDDFDDFQNALNSVHGSIHGRVGGNMSSVSYAGYDPIFYLHHANVDRLWAQWQSSHTLTLPAEEAALGLDPFERPCSTGFYVGSDMESTESLGYRYMNFCILVLGPLVLTPIPLDLDPWILERLGRAKLVLRASRMPSTTMEIRVFVDEPKADARTPVDDNPRFAGSFGVFGMTSGPGGRGHDRHGGGGNEGGGNEGGGHDSRGHEGGGNEGGGHDSRGHEGGGHGGGGHDSGGHEGGVHEGGGHEGGGHGGGNHDGGDMPMAMRGERFDLQIDITRALAHGIERGEGSTLTLVPVDAQGERVPEKRLDFDGLELMVQ